MGGAFFAGARWAHWIGRVFEAGFIGACVGGDFFRFAFFATVRDAARVPIDSVRGGIAAGLDVLWRQISLHLGRPSHRLFLRIL